MSFSLSGTRIQRESSKGSQEIPGVAGKFGLGVQN